jgi:hypothetical protein
MPGDGPTEDDPLGKYFTLVEAARFLRINPDSLRKKLARNEVPGARKWNTRWVFDKAALADFRKTYRASPGRPPGRRKR